MLLIGLQDSQRFVECPASYRGGLRSFMDPIASRGAIKPMDLDDRSVRNFRLAVRKKRYPRETDAAYGAVSALLGCLGCKTLMPAEFPDDLGIENKGRAL